MNLDDLLETGNVWFTGCTHFGHSNIINLAKRPFADVREMDMMLVDNWNRIVKPEDAVFHLGDFAWSRHSDYLPKLNGNMMQIRGNHDHGVPWASVPYLELVSRDHPSLVLFHYPIEEWNGWWRGSIHLHCHTHQHQKITGKNRVNVSVEAWKYAPVSLAEVVEQARVSSEGLGREEGNTMHKGFEQ